MESRRDKAVPEPATAAGGRIPAMRNPAMVVSLVASLCSAVIPAIAQLTIDDFAVVQSLNHSTINAGSVSEVSGAGILGGVRMIRLTQGASAGSLSGTVSAGVLTMSTTTLGDLEVWWDGVDDDGFTPAGLGGIDLTGGGSFDHFLLDVTANSLPGDLMRLQIWINGGDRCETQFAMPVGLVVVPFANFSTCTGAATAASASQNAGAVFLRTVLRPGAWSFTLGAVQTTPVSLLDFTVE